jgi:hypothetical protein
MEEYPWYEIVAESEELEQGDYIDACTVVTPTYTPIEAEAGAPGDTGGYEATGDTDIYNVVIVSQSCDLENGKLDYVLLCPRISYSDLAKSYIDRPNQLHSYLEEIRLGRRHRYCMLHQCSFDEFPQEIQIIDLGQVFSVPYHVMKQMAKSGGKRLRLLSPYKEKLAQAFAYYYMRVALPIDIPHFNKKQVMVQPSLKYGH